MAVPHHDHQSLPGWNELCERIGKVPVFADAPITRLEVSLSGTMTLELTTWPIDQSGYFKTDQPLQVSIFLNGTTRIELSDFAPTAFIDELTFSQTRVGWRIEWEAGYGVTGAAEAKSIKIGFADG